MRSPHAIRRLSKRAGELQRELGALVRAICPELLELSGCGTLTVAKLIAETARGRGLFIRRQVRARASPAWLRSLPRRAHRPPSPGPWRKPPAQLRASPHRRHAGPRLPGPQGGRGQGADGGAALPKRQAGPRRLAEHAGCQPGENQLPIPNPGNRDAGSSAGLDKGATRGPLAADLGFRTSVRGRNASPLRRSDPQDGRHAACRRLARIGGIEVSFANRDLWFGSMPNARKAHDLRRDQRFALHSGSIDPPDWEGDAKISGRAQEVEPNRFHADIEEAVVVRLNEARGGLVIELWRPGRELKRIERA